MLSALIDDAPNETDVVPRYAGKRRCLMLYGPGSREKLPIVRRHLKFGGRVSMWDLGYWDRADSMRLSIDAMHPTSQQIARSPTNGRRRFELRDDADRDGPILLIGLGPKSVFAYGLGLVHSWEMAKVAELRRRFPGREILWRPKGDKPLPLLDLQMRHGMPIDEALHGCSQVVCRHSNVAVDACIAGVPVECEEGAAAALYRGNPAPTREQRMDFLNRLTWWNWSRFEAADAWMWIEKVTAA
jgi:hypothetical protein